MLPLKVPGRRVSSCSSCRRQRKATVRFAVCTATSSASFASNSTRSSRLLNLPDRALVRRLVAEDNNDRNALYEAIARANDRPEWEADIRRIFAQRWIERGARPGWYYQDGDGNWQQR